MNKHNDCLFFAHNNCEHKDDEIMKIAAQDFPKFYGKTQYETSQSAAVDAICSSCDKFTRKG
jgi:hypothetical protein